MIQKKIALLSLLCFLICPVLRASAAPKKAPKNKTTFQYLISTDWDKQIEEAEDKLKDPQLKADLIAFKTLLPRLKTLLVLRIDRCNALATTESIEAKKHALLYCMGLDIKKTKQLETAIELYKNEEQEKAADEKKDFTTALTHNAAIFQIMKEQRFLMDHSLPVNPYIHYSQLSAMVDTRIADSQKKKKEWQDELTKQCSANPEGISFRNDFAQFWTLIRDESQDLQEG